MRKLGIWSRGGIVALLLLAGTAGLAQAQERDEVAWLGVVTQSLSGELREGMDYNGDGVLVTRVVNDGPADRAGIERGDVLVTLNGRSIRSPDALTRMIRDAEVGRTVSLTVVRDDRRRSISVRLGRRPDDVSRSVPGFDRFPREFDLESPRIEGGEGSPLLRGMGRGRLGVRVEDMSEDLAPYFESEKGSGALVVEVLDDTPASRAGLKAGDVITRVGDRRVEDSEDLVVAVREAPQGRTSITVSRKGQERVLEAELEEGPRSFRIGPGRDMMVLRPRERRNVTPRAPQARDEAAMEQELQDLRKEVQELRRQLDEMHDRDDDDRDEDRGDDDDDDR